MKRNQGLSSVVYDVLDSTLALRNLIDAAEIGDNETYSEFHSLIGSIEKSVCVYHNKEVSELLKHPYVLQLKARIKELEKMH